MIFEVIKDSLKILNNYNCLHYFPSFAIHFRFAMNITDIDNL